MIRYPAMRQILGLSILVTTAGGIAMAETPARPNSGEQQISAIEKRAGLRLGVAALDSGSGRRIEYRAGERFLLCSTFKFLAAAAVLHRVDEKQEQLNRFIRYTKADLLQYAPVTTAHLSAGGMTLAALCEAAITLSDNTAGNLLLQTIGGPEGLTRYARALGDQQTRLDRLEPDLNSTTPGDERDTTTPRAMLGDLRRLLLGDALSKSSRTQLMDWLAASKTGDKLIRAGLPKDWKVGDKTGNSGSGAINDIAIIQPPAKAPILLAIYTVGSAASTNDRPAAIAEIARLVAETF